MKLCFSTLACPTWDLGRIVDAAIENGIEGVDFRGIGEEIDITKLPAFNAELDATLAFLRQRGIKMPCLNTSVTLVSPAPDRWAAMLDECHRYAQLARRTSTRFIRCFGGEVPVGMTRDEARSMAQRHLRQLAKICRPHDCQVVLETHDAWSTSAEVLELVHEFQPDEAGVLWDMEHTHRRGEPSRETGEKLRRYVRHVHIKDSVRKEKKNSPRLLGEGDLPLAEFVAALHGIDYDGWLCLETEKRWHAEAPEPEQSIPQFAAYTRKLLGK
ncbi:MAG: sugar phosphate isomerase/epimerase family protein [Tepidisphaeraceae bacterium]